MGRPWSYEAPEGIFSEIGGGDKKLFDRERKFWGEVKDNRCQDPASLVRAARQAT